MRRCFVLAIETAFGGDGASPEEDVRIRDREPVAVVIQFQEYRVGLSKEHDHSIGGKSLGHPENQPDRWP
jgi:hypothetical protein